MLLIAFIGFVILLLPVALILRNRSVQDVLDDKGLSSLRSIDSSSPEFYQQPEPREKQKLSSGNVPASGLEMNRENINKIGKILSVIGVIALFLPVPEVVKFLGLFFLFLGSIVSKLSKPDAEKKTKKSANSTVQKIRLLAAKPEYGEALKLLYEDKSENPQAAESVHYQRAVQYLQKKGVSADEAKENLTLLAGLMGKRKPNP